MGFSVQTYGQEPSPALQALASRLEQGELPPGAVEVRRSSVRVTVRATLSDQTAVFVKRDRPRGLWERVRYLVRRPRALAEARSLQRVRALGIPAPQPLLTTLRRRAGLVTESVLVTRSLGAVRSLSDQLGAAEGPARAEALRLLHAVADYTRTLHEAGLFHRDHHLGNIAVLDSAPVSVALLDLQKMVKLPRLLLANRAQDLARLLEVLTKPERRRAIWVYAQNPALARRLAPRVEAAIRRWRRRHLRSRERRCVVRSTGFRIDRPGDGTRVFRRADLALSAAQAVAASHRATLGRPGDPAVVKRDRRTLVTRQPEPPGPDGARSAAPPPGPELAVKSYPPRGALGALSAAIVGHRGLRAWRAAHALRVRGLPTPAPLALLERRRFGLCLEATLVIRWVPDALPLPLFVRRYVEGNRRREAWRAGLGGPLPEPLAPWEENGLVQRLGALFATLHAHRIYHPDLKPPNILVSRARRGDAPPPDPRLQLWLLDLDGLRTGALHPRRRVKNLAQLEDFAWSFLPEVRRTHRARFLRAYAAGTGLGRQEVRRLVRRVRSAVARRALARARRGRDWPPGVQLG